MPYIIRHTNDPVKHPEQARDWKAFQDRARREGRPLAWIIWQLIKRYVARGLD